MPRKALKRATRPRGAVEAPRSSRVKLPKTRRDFMKALDRGYRMGWEAGWGAGYASASRDWEL
jgi:hypothetical protein